MELFRFLTAGSVDDGKSTLIGHLLHLVNALKSDQLDQVKVLSKNDQAMNYAFFTDGLRSEREQGITIDVSYKYFTTKKRKFIIADCPGHKEFTRNMFTGASTADLVVLLINIENGITEQTKRHLKIGQLLNIPNIVFCINKMDLVDYDQSPFETLKAACLELIDESETKHFFIPISATNGDNLTANSDKMDWYSEASLLTVLNSAQTQKQSEQEACFPVQYGINQFDSNFLFGNVFEGCFRTGEIVRLFPNNKEVRIRSLMQYEEVRKEIRPGQYGSVVLDLDEQIIRGSIIVKEGQSDCLKGEFFAQLCWMDEIELNNDQSYILKLATQEVECVFKEIIDSDTGNKQVKLNSLFLAELITKKEIVVRPFKLNKTLGAFILINKQTNHTVAGGVVV